MFCLALAEVPAEGKGAVMRVFVAQTGMQNVMKILVQNKLLIYSWMFPICYLTGLKHEPDPAFREVSLGQWEGLSRAQIIERYPEDFELRSRDIINYRIQGGESFADLRDRVMPRLMAVLAQHRGKNLLLVAHGGVNRVILCNALGLELAQMTHIDQAYGCLNIIDYFDGMPVVRLMNELPLNGLE